MFTGTFLSSAAQTAENSGSTTGSVLYMVVSIGLMLVVFYFLLIRPQKKKEKDSKNMRNNLQIGDEVITIGGIVGIVVKKGEDTVVIETGGDRSKIRIKVWAISENTTVHDNAEESAKKKKD